MYIVYPGYKAIDVISITQYAVWITNLNITACVASLNPFVTHS